MIDRDQLIMAYIFFILIVAYSRSLILFALLLIITAILIVKIPAAEKSEMIQQFKSERAIFQILVIILIIVAIYELITVGTLSGYTAIIALLLMIIRLYEWLIKKEE